MKKMGQKWVGEEQWWKVMKELCESGREEGGKRAEVEGNERI